MCFKYRKAFHSERTECDYKNDWRRGVLLFIVYGCLVIVLVALYLGLHYAWPAQTALPINLVTSLTEAESLVENTTLEISDTVALPSSAGLSAGLTGDAAVQFDALYKLLLRNQAISAQKARLTVQLTALRTEVTNSQGIDRDKIYPIIDKTLVEVGRESWSPAVVKVYLESIRQALSASESRYFWSTGWLKWLELFMWALLGTFFFALWQIQHWLRKKPVGEFHQHQWWYITMTIRGPFVALLLLFAFSTIKLDVVNIGFDLTTMPIEAWIFLAGIMGIFSYVAYQQLCIIVKAIFAKAWAMTDDSPGINPEAAAVPFGSSALFISSQKNVNWDVIPSTIGSIDNNGKFTAPKEVNTETGIISGVQLFVRATNKDDPSKVSVSKVTLYQPFAIKSETKTAESKTHKFIIDPPCAAKIKWCVDPPDQGTIDDNGLFTPSANAVSGTQLIITAALADKTSVSSETRWLLKLDSDRNIIE